MSGPFLTLVDMALRPPHLRTVLGSLVAPATLGRRQSVEVVCQAVRYSTAIGALQDRLRENGLISLRN